MVEHRMGRIPTFSLEERDRRWTRVRGFLAREGLDAVIATPNTSHWDAFQADVRYLTQIGGNNTEGGVIFPLDGEVTAIVRSEDHPAWWSVQQDWVTDVRISGHRYSGLIAERLHELRLGRGRRRRLDDDPVGRRPAAAVAASDAHGPRL
jgi:Xaa-Pro dipeptidase